MKIVSKNENCDLFKKMWSSFTKVNIDASHCEIQRIEYYLITNKHLLVSDESFVLIDDENKCSAICFLPIYANSNYSYCDGFAPIALKKKYLDKSFEYINALFNKNKIAKIELAIDVCFSTFGPWKNNYLRDYGFIDTSTNSHILHLDNDEEALFLQFNASTRKIIRKAQRQNNHNIKVYDQNNINKLVFMNYKKYHKICAGHQTRSDESFNSMFELIKSNKSILIELNYFEKAVGYLLLFLQYPYADMASMANLPEYEEDLPIYRLLLWHAIRFCSNYKLLIGGFPAGESLVDGFKSYMDEKQLRISKYKSFVGFNSTQVYRGVKYFDKKIMLDDVRIFEDKLKDSLS